MRPLPKSFALAQGHRRMDTFWVDISYVVFHAIAALAPLARLFLQWSHDFSVLLTQPRAPSLETRDGRWKPPRKARVPERQARDLGRSHTSSSVTGAFRSGGVAARSCR